MTARAVAAAVLVAVAACTAGEQPPPVSRPRPPVVEGQPPAVEQPPPPGTYVALGDSVAAGVGDREGGGYVDRLAALLQEDGACGGAGCPALSLVDVSASGATTASVLSGQLAPATAALRAAAPDAPRLVTLTVGGNDVVGPLATACTDGITQSCLRVVRDSYRSVEANLTRILAEVRAAAGPGATVAVMTYYNSFLTCRLSALAPLADRVLDGDPALGLPGFDGLLASVASAEGAVVVRTREVVGPDGLVGGGDCLHPNARGHARIAERFRDVVGPLLAPGRR